jgi:sister-chromatid-cohesion protein PDS5
VDEHQRLKNEEYMKYLAGKNTSIEREPRDNLQHLLLAHFPDRARTYNSLLAYTSICTKKNIKMLKTSINPDSEYKVIIKAKVTCSFFFFFHLVLKNASHL